MIKVIALLFFLLLPTTTSAQINNEIKVYTSTGNGNGNASSTVNITNKVNTEKNNQIIDETTKSDIQIHQDGNGSSKVSINGKNYEVEGAGDLSVTETSNKPTSPSTTFSPSPTTSPSATPTPTENNSPKTITGEINKIVSGIKELINKIINLI